MTDVAEMAQGSDIYYVAPDDFESPMRFGDIQPRSWGDYNMPVYMPPSLQGSDLSTDLVAKSNYEAWQEIFEDSEDDKWVAVVGGHGSYGIAVRADVNDRDIIETLASLSEYPLISDDKLSEIEDEARSESWERWVRSDFIQAIERRPWTIDGREAEVVDFDEGELDLRQWFEEMADKANEHWSDDSIDVHRVVDAMDGNDIKWAILNGAEVDIEPADN